MHWTIRKLLMGLGALATGVAAVVGITAAWTTSLLISAVATSEATGKASRQQMSADMMHDAVRSDVLRAFHSARHGAADRVEVSKELDSDRPP